jgi:hypothetical protein
MEEQNDEQIFFAAIEIDRPVAITGIFFGMGGFSHGLVYYCEPCGHARIHERVKRHHRIDDAQLANRGISGSGVRLCLSRLYFGSANSCARGFDTETVAKGAREERRY